MRYPPMLGPATAGARAGTDAAEDERTSQSRGSWLLVLALSLLLMLGLSMTTPAAAQEAAPADDVAAMTLLEALDVDSFPAKGRAIEAIVHSDDPRARDWLQALLDGRLAPSVDDVLALAGPVLRHRMALNFAARAEGVTVDDVIDRLCEPFA